MKSEFEKWYRDKYQITKPLYFFENTHRYEDGFTQDAWEVWQHQQAKIDELQKRVDAAQKLFDDWDCGGVNLFDLLDELEQALKGGDQNTEKQPKNIATKGVKGGDQ